VAGKRYFAFGVEQIGSGGSNRANVIGELAAEYLRDRYDRTSRGVDGSIGISGVGLAESDWGLP
jgi:hypothetical protein